MHKHPTKAAVVIILVLAGVIVVCTVIAIIVILLILPKIREATIYTVTPTPTVSVTSTPVAPTPTAEIPTITIKDGNVVAITGSGSKIIANKVDFKDIDRFIEVFVSPDGEKICFLGESEVPEYLYMANADGSAPREVALARSCDWSPDSKYIAYINHTTDVSPNDVNLYTVTTAAKKNLTASKSSDNITRIYSNPVWSSDGTTISAKYNELNFGNGTDDMQQKSGTSVINIITGSITDN